MKHDWRIIDMKIDRNTTLMILRDGDCILFGLKKRGFGKGKKRSEFEKKGCRDVKTPL